MPGKNREYHPKGLFSRGRWTRSLLQHSKLMRGSIFV